MYSTRPAREIVASSQPSSVAPRNPGVQAREDVNWALTFQVFLYRFMHMDKSPSEMLAEIKATTRWGETTLAAHLDVSQATVNRILRGKVDCRGSTLRRISTLHHRVMIESAEKREDELARLQRDFIEAQRSMQALAETHGALRADSECRMTTVYREFVLRSPAIWSGLVSFVKGNAKSCLDRGEPLRLIITTEERKRNAEQNRFYWGVVLRDIAEQAWTAGRQFDKDTWHEYFARQFGVCEEITLPDGEIITRRKSTTQMTVGEFSEYMNKVMAYAANDLGVLFDV